MKIEFWEERWNQNQIAFHLQQVNPYLLKHLPDFKLTDNANIFVPLCGKSVDLAWLMAQKYNTLGLECSDKAICEFYNEQKLTAELSSSENYRIYCNDNLTILQGDFFKLNKSILKDIDFVYDRASLIALPEAMRQQYVELLRAQLPEKAQMLLITLEYNQQKMSGPPFAVHHNEVMELYEPLYQVEILHEGNVLDGHLKFKERGLDYLIERVYRLKMRN